jgi:hypothetical protein
VFANRRRVKQSETHVINFRAGETEVAQLRYLLTVALACLVGTAGASARAQKGFWTIQVSDDGTIVAGIAMDHPGASGTTVVTLMNVGFGPKSGCQPEIGIAMLKGDGYGTPVGKISPPHTEPVNLTVDQQRVSTQAPFLVKYDNGLEVVFAADQKVLGALAAGTTATVQIVPGTPRFEFPITGAGGAIAEARKRCLSRH